MDRERAYYEWNWSSEDAAERRDLVGEWRRIDRELDFAADGESST
ncbi:hypothetical protein [Pseudonocardia broussonetiae]|nr:hypothetical protein [Pseudonocardia broussonetiae]